MEGEGGWHEAILKRAGFRTGWKACATKANALAEARAFGNCRSSYFAYRKSSTQMKSTSDSTKARPMIIAV